MSRQPSRHAPGAELADLSRGLLAHAQAAKVRAHVEHCSRCQGALERIEQGLAGMAQVAAQEAPELSWDHIGARVYWSTSSERRARERRGQPRAGHWRLAMVGVAGAAVVAGGVFWGLGRATSPAPRAASNPSTPRITASELTSPAEPERVEGAIVLSQGAVVSDGHAVAFNEPIVAGSRFSTGEGQLVVQFGANSAFRIAPKSTLTVERLDSARIALRIEGRVDVDLTRRLPGQEFAIIAGEHEVQVRGTAFRVDYVDDELGVQCIRGKVVVTDGDHGVHVSAGQRFQILRDAWGDAALRALPIDPPALEALEAAMQMPMLPVWNSAHEIPTTTALLELDSGSDLAIAVDGSYVAAGAFTLRTSIGQHEVALVDGDGGLSRGRLLTAAAGEPTRAHLQPPSKPLVAGRALRKRQLTAALADSPRPARCLAQLEKQGLLAGSYLELDVGLNADGSQSYLNVLDSNLSPVIQGCLRDAVDAERLPAGSATSFRFRLSY